MRFVELARLFYEWGWEIKHEHYTAFSDYLKEMLKKDRVMVILKDVDIEAVIMFYITDDYEKVYKKGNWEIVKDDANGNLMYIDKMVCKKFSIELHRAINNAIAEKFPQVEEAMYLREPNDRRVTIKMRRQLCTK